MRAVTWAFSLGRGNQLAMQLFRDGFRRGRELSEATEAAHALGVFGVPTVEVAGELFWGDDRLEDAAAYAGSVGHAA